MALEDLGPFQLATARVLLAAAIFAPAILRTRTEIGAREGLTLGFLGIVLYYATFNVGLASARATDAGVIQASIPAVSALLAIPILAERANAWTWSGIGLSFAGVALLVRATTGSGEGSLAGDLWIAASVLDWALYSVYVRRLSRRASGTAITAAALGWGALLLVPLGLAELLWVRPSLTVPGAAAVVFLAVFAGALGYWLWSYGLARLRAGQATIYLNLLPLVAAASGVLVLGERLTGAEPVAAA
ncbi:MAG TPA: EamA family transporter, partial [Candidatus Limnocylindrales bacterium]|nr:EamA family transporter [Candidatus Limnocylindrales bacterium]